jgi:hypothetical protein
VRRLVGALLVATAACSAPAPPGDDAAVPLPADADPGGDPQTPPQSPGALEAWLAAGHHRQPPWVCEEQISAPRLSGTHGRHRVCSNARLLASVAGLYPAGAASVKDLYTPDDAPNGFAVAVKIADGDGPRTWYWYERHGPQVTLALPLAQGVGVPDCAVCHGTAPRDYIFVRAQ